MTIKHKKIKLSSKLHVKDPTPKLIYELLTFIEIPMFTIVFPKVYFVFSFQPNYLQHGHLTRKEFRAYLYTHGNLIN